MALGGGWSEGHDITDDELALWQDVTTNHADGYEAVDFASLGNPISVPSFFQQFCWDLDFENLIQLKSFFLQ